MFRTLTSGLAATLLMAGAAHAATLVDTGTPNGSLPALAVDAIDWVAVQFDLATATRIDSVAAYLVGGSSGEHFALSLYQDAPGLPGDLLASQTLSFGADGWNAASGLGWQLAAGRYWLGVEGIDGNFSAPAGGLLEPGSTAFADGSHNGSYQALAGLQFGLQIQGAVAAAVPEPSSTALLLAGLGVVAWAMHRRRA